MARSSGFSIDAVLASLRAELLRAAPEDRFAIVERWPYKGERLLAVVSEYVGLVDNGGFDYLFACLESPKQYAIFRQMLLALGAGRHAELLAQAWARFSRRGPLQSELERYVTLQSGPEVLEQLARTYYESHPLEFERTPEHRPKVDD